VPLFLLLKITEHENIVIEPTKSLACLWYHKDQWKHKIRSRFSCFIIRLIKCIQNRIGNVKKTIHTPLTSKDSPLSQRETKENRERFNNDSRQPVLHSNQRPRYKIYS
jgi:hypothetical protein